MPRYTIQDPTGRQLTVEGATPPTPRQIKAIFDANPAPAPAEGGVWESVKQGGKGLLELVGRPGEFVSGFVGGAAQGGVGEGLRRGAAAAFEPTLTDSKIQESFGKVLEEQGALKESPLTRTLAGFAGDVLLDPLNLLGGAGLLRKGAIKAAGAVGKGEEAAKVVNALSDVYRSKVTEPISATAREFAAKTPGLQRLQRFPELVGLKTPTSSLDAQQFKRISEGRINAAADMARQKVEALKNQLTPQEYEAAKQKLSFAITETDKAMLADIKADPKLASLSDDITRLMDAVDTKELAEGLRTPYLDVNLGKKAQAQLNALKQADFRTLKKALETQAVDDLPEGPLKTVADRIMRDLTAADGTLLYNPAALKWKRLASGEIAVQKHSSQLKYLPAYVEKPGARPPATIFQAVRPTMQEAKERTLSFPEAVAQGAETDVFKILERRLVASARAQENVRYITETVERFGSATPQGGYRALKETTKKQFESVPALERLAGTYFPAPIADDLERSIAILNDPDTLEGVGRRGLKLFKALATSLNIPYYPATNFLGNVMNMHLSGMSAPEISAGITASTRAMRRAEQLVESGSDSRTLFKLKDLSDADVLRAARENNVIGRSSGFATEFQEPTRLTPTAQMLMTGSLNPLNPENRVYSYIRGKGQFYIEDPAKLALFAHELRKGKSVDEATMTVKTFLFDYGDLSDLERNRLASTLIPFYTWTRKNVPLYLGSVVTRPSSLAQQQRLAQLANDVGRLDQDSQKRMEEALPSYLRRADQIQLSSQATAPVQGRLRLPLYDINRPFEALGAPMDTAAEMLNPFIRAAIELPRGETLRGQQIRTGYGAPTPLGEALGLAGSTEGGQRLQSNLSRYLTNLVPIPTVLRPLLTEPKEGTTQPALENILYRALGLSPTELTEDIYRQGQRERQRERAARTTRLRSEALGASLR